LSSNGSDAFLKVLKLSSEVSESKPLPAALVHGALALGARAAVV
jgi:hypothetical protein